MLSHCIPSSRVEQKLSDDESAQENRMCKDFVNKQQQDHTCKSVKLENHFDLLHFGQSETEKMIWAMRQDTNKKIIQNDLAKSNIGLIEAKENIIYSFMCIESSLSVNSSRSPIEPSSFCQSFWIVIVVLSILFVITNSMCGNGFHHTQCTEQRQ